jgi:hypothetical protein
VAGVTAKSTGGQRAQKKSDEYGELHASLIFVNYLIFTNILSEAGENM